MAKANLKSTFKLYAQEVRTELERLMADNIVSQIGPSSMDEDRLAFSLPRRIARIEDGPGGRPVEDKNDTVSSEYVKTVLEADRWGVRFKDDSVIMLSFLMDEQNSRNNEFVPASFSYLFAAGERLIDGTMERAHFYRIEMHPNEYGTLFGEPVVHLHGNRNKAPRFGISAAISPLDFLDFVVRNRFPKEWEKRRSEQFRLMHELHVKYTEHDKHYRISDFTAYERQSELLKQLSLRRGIPEWKEPPTARRYPYSI